MALSWTTLSAPRGRDRPAVRLALGALLVWLVALAFYWGTAALVDNTRTPGTAHFDRLADAFLHGRLHLSDPPRMLDLTQHEGHWYVPFPPLPALLLLPWVALLGVEGLSTVVFSVVFGALNVSLVYLFLEALAIRGWSRLRTADNLWLVLLFGLGSVHWHVAVQGSVWQVGQTCTVTFIALAAFLAAFRRGGWLAGVALGLAMLARPHVVLCWPLLLGIAAEGFRRVDGRVEWPRWTAWAAASLVPLLAAMAGLLVYNYARFNDALDFGYVDQNVAPHVRDDLATYGQFSLHYVPRNLWAMWLALPQWNAVANCPVPSREGMSLLLTTPALVWLVRARRRSYLVAGAWGAVAVLLVPLVTYYTTGWEQFGYRFSLDFMVPVMALLAIAAGKSVSRSLRALILAGVAVDAWGIVWWFGFWP